MAGPRNLGIAFSCIDNTPVDRVTGNAPCPFHVSLQCQISNAFTVIIVDRMSTYIKAKISKCVAGLGRFVEFLGFMVSLYFHP